MKLNYKELKTINRRKERSSFHNKNESISFHKFDLIFKNFKNIIHSHDYNSYFKLYDTLNHYFQYIIKEEIEIENAKALDEFLYDTVNILLEVESKDDAVFISNIVYNIIQIKQIHLSWMIRINCFDLFLNKVLLIIQDQKLVFSIIFELVKDNYDGCISLVNNGFLDYFIIKFKSLQDESIQYTISKIFKHTIKNLNNTFEEKDQNEIDSKKYEALLHLIDDLMFEIEIQPYYIVDLISVCIRYGVDCGKLYISQSLIKHPIAQKDSHLLISIFNLVKSIFSNHLKLAYNSRSKLINNEEIISMFNWKFFLPFMEIDMTDVDNCFCISFCNCITEILQHSNELSNSCNIINLPSYLIELANVKPFDVKIISIKALSMLPENQLLTCIKSGYIFMLADFLNCFDNNVLQEIINSLLTLLFYIEEGKEHSEKIKEELLASHIIENISELLKRYEGEHVTLLEYLKKIIDRVLL